MSTEHDIQVERLTREMRSVVRALTSLENGLYDLRLAIAAGFGVGEDVLRRQEHEHLMGEPENDGEFRRRVKDAVNR